MPPTQILVHSPLVTHAVQATSRPPTLDPTIVWLVAGALFMLTFCAIGIAVCVECLYRRKTSDLKARRKAKSSPRIYQDQPTITATKIMSCSEKPCNGLPLPAVHTSRKPSKLRDSVICKALGRLPFSYAGKGTVSQPPFSPCTVCSFL